MLGERVDSQLLPFHLLLLLTDPLVLLLRQRGELSLLCLQLGEGFLDVGHSAVPLDLIMCSL